MLGTDLESYTPRQPYQLGLPGIECVLLPPAKRHAPSVHYYWTLSVSEGRAVLPVVPDNALDLVLCPSAADWAELYFPVARRFDIELEGPVRYVGICLKLDRLGVALGLPPAVLRALAPGVETFERLGVGPLTERLSGGEAEPDTVAAALDAFLDRRGSNDSGSTDPGANADVSLFEHFTGAFESEPVAETARRAGLSERQLRRVTRQLFGLGPKKLQRVVRLQRALAELIERAPPRADYHDDSHRIRELRALTGWTPGEIRRMAERYNSTRRRSLRLRTRTPTEKRR